ncbi:hypothetical protein T484DRAFT_1987665 [Baffinella frigidus]|nr:hypothetical protein T484DRAFT_1987665 [Cryptophyta sp. CCMP2293]
MYAPPPRLCLSKGAERGHVHYIRCVRRETGKPPPPSPGKFLIQSHLSSRRLVQPLHELALITVALQGYLAHKKAPPLGPYSRPMPRALWWS